MALAKRMDRLDNSVNGNPRYRVYLGDGGVYITSSDAGFVYAINNPEMRAKVDVWLTRAGRIAHMAPHKD